MVWFPTMSSGGHYTNNSFANLPYSNMLPMMYTNYGGDFQAVTIDPFQNYTLGYAFNPIAQASWGTGSCMTPGITPSVNVQEAENFGRNILFGELSKETSNIISQELNTLSAMKNKLQSKLKEEGISEEDKTKIQEILDKIEEKEKEVQQLKESKDMDADAAYQKANKLGTEIQELCKEAQTVLAGKTESSDKSDTDTDSAEKTDDKDKADAADKKPDEKQGAVDEFDSKTIAAVDKFYHATYDGWGTDDEKMEEALKEITEDNVMDFMLCWNKFHSSEENESFMEAFMWDADHTQKRNDGANIATKLRAKANELGIFDECKENFANIDRELGSWWISNDISEDFDAIIAKIAQKMGSKYGSPYKKDEASKTEQQ